MKSLTSVPSESPHCTNETELQPYSANQSSFHIHESRPNNDDVILRGLVYCSYACKVWILSVSVFFSAADWESQFRRVAQPWFIIGPIASSIICSILPAAIFFTWVAPSVTSRGGLPHIITASKLFVACCKSFPPASLDINSYVGMVRNYLSPPTSRYADEMEQHCGRRLLLRRHQLLIFQC